MMTDEDRNEKIDRVRSGTDKMFDDKMDINLKEKRRRRNQKTTHKTKEGRTEIEEEAEKKNHNIALKTPITPNFPLILFLSSCETRFTGADSDSISIFLIFFSVVVP